MKEYQYYYLVAFIYMAPNTSPWIAVGIGVLHAIVGMFMSFRGLDKK